MLVPHAAYRGVTPSQNWMGYPPNQETDQHSKHLLHGGQCATCVHTRELSCSYFGFGSC